MQPVQKTLFTPNDSALTDWLQQKSAEYQKPEGLPSDYDFQGGLVLGADDDSKEITLINKLVHAHTITIIASRILIGSGAILRACYVHLEAEVIEIVDDSFSSIWTTLQAKEKLTIRARHIKIVGAHILKPAEGLEFELAESVECKGLTEGTYWIAFEFFAKPPTDTGTCVIL